MLQKFLGNRRRMLQPIFLILLLAFAVQFTRINAPVSDWREADTAAMARNFYEHRYNILYPQIDWGGTSSGYVESEFPLYQFAVATIYQAFGVNEALARLLSVLLSLASIYFVYALACRLIGKNAAIWSASFFAFLPFQFVFAHVIMPEPLVILGITAGVYFFFRWYQQKSLLNILLSASFIAIACLLKPQSMYLFLPLIYLAWLRYRFRLFLQPHLWVFLGMAVLPLIAWYYHAHQLFYQSGLSFGIWGGYGTDKWGNWGMLVTLQFWRTIIIERFAPQLALLGLIILYIGLLIKRRSREEYFLDFWMIALLIYVIIVAKGTFVHTYYLAPSLVPASMIMGKACDRYFHKLAWRAWGVRQIALTLVLILMAVPAGNDFVTLFNDQRPSRLLALASTIQDNSKPDDLIVTVDSMDPTLLYLSHRKGWTISAADLNRKYPGASYIAGFNYDQSFFYKYQGGQS